MPSGIVGTSSPAAGFSAAVRALSAFRDTVLTVLKTPQQGAVRARIADPQHHLSRRGHG
jgi:hypothetical protein